MNSSSRGEVIFQFLALARIARRRLHLLCAALDVKAAKFRDARIAGCGIGEPLGIDPEVMGVFDYISQFVEARANGMSPVLLRAARYLDQPFVAVMGDGGAYPHQRLAFEAAAYPVHFSVDGRRPKAFDPAAADLVRLPRRIMIRILHPVHAGCDHFAD